MIIHCTEWLGAYLVTHTNPQSVACETLTAALKVVRAVVNMPSPAPIPTKQGTP